MRNMSKRQLGLTLRLKQNGQHFTDDIFELIFLFENSQQKISLNFVPESSIVNKSVLIQVMAWPQ